MDAPECAAPAPPDPTPRETLARTLGAILRSKRAFYTYTQQQVEEATQIHRARVGRFEAGKVVPDVWEAVQLALLMHMPLEELLQPYIEFVRCHLPPE